MKLVSVGAKAMSILLGSSLFAVSAANAGVILSPEGRSTVNVRRSPSPNAPLAFQLADCASITPVNPSSTLYDTASDDYGNSWVKIQHAQHSNQQGWVRAIYVSQGSLRCSSDRSGEQPQTEKPPSVPQIEGLTYDEARKKLIEAGWQPRNFSPSDRMLRNPTSGNSGAFLQKGYQEIYSCAATGAAYCNFEFQDNQGRYLKVISAGEENPQEGVRAKVNDWSIYQQPFEARR